jgi:hypothetical protein
MFVTLGTITLFGIVPPPPPLSSPKKKGLRVSYGDNTVYITCNKHLESTLKHLESSATTFESDVWK